MDKNYPSKTIEISPKRTLKAFTVTFNSDGSQVVDATFSQQRFDRNGVAVAAENESLTTTDLDTVTDSIDAISTFLDSQKDVQENDK